MGSENSNLIGNGDNNCLGPNAGQNTIDGLGGNEDILLLQGKLSEYTIQCSNDTGGADVDASCTVTDQVTGRDGITVTKNIELFVFQDVEYDPSTEASSSDFSKAALYCKSRLLI